MSSSQTEPERPMTLFERRSVAITSASAAISLLGLLSVFYLAYQTKIAATEAVRAAESLDSSAFHDITGQLLDLDKLLLEHSTLRPYFESCQAVTPSDPNDAQVRGLSDYHLDLFESIITQVGHLHSISESDRNAWYSFMRDTFAMSPAVCRQINDHRTWYSTDLLAEADKYCHPCPSAQTH